MRGAAGIHEQIDTIYQRESRRVLATLIRLVGDFELAEEALHEAFAAALEQWPESGIPEQPRAWLVSTGRFKSIDRIRRRGRFQAAQDDIVDLWHPTVEAEISDDDLDDDHLRLIFTCCHPALAPEARVAMTLREVCGLTTEEVASAFLIKPATVAQRIVRAKGKIKRSGIPYEVPEGDELPARLDSVLQVIYLVFNEAYSASSGESLIRRPLAREAIRLGRELAELIPQAEIQALLALMLLQDSRRDARVSGSGDLIRLQDQDRGLWDRGQIEEGVALVEAALRQGRAGPYALQAAIAAVHAEAADWDSTDWDQLVGLYEVLSRIQTNPVVSLNQAVAIAMRDGPPAGLARIEALMASGELDDYHLLHAAYADLQSRQGNVDAARAAYRRALALAEQEPERRFLARQLDGIGGAVPKTVRSRQ